jgi:hypothetical protein
MPEIQLKIYRSPSEHHTETYRQSRVTVGREINNDIVVPEKGISRFQCQLDYDEQGWRIVDLDSTNGTFVNGISVKKAAVKNGDVVVVGSVRLHVLECSARAPAAGLPGVCSDSRLEEADRGFPSAGQTTPVAPGDGEQEKADGVSPDALLEQLRDCLADVVKKGAALADEMKTYRSQQAIVADLIETVKQSEDLAERLSRFLAPRDEAPG